MADLLIDTLTLPNAVDFFATPTEGSNRLITQFTLFEPTPDLVLDSLTEVDTFTDTLEA